MKKGKPDMKRLPATIDCLRLPPNYLPLIRRSLDHYDVDAFVYLLLPPGPIGHMAPNLWIYMLRKSGPATFASLSDTKDLHWEAQGTVWRAKCD